MEEKQNTNPFDSIFSDLKFIKDEMADIKSALAAPASPEKKFYSISETSKKLGVSKITIYRNVQAGKIPGKKVGSRVMIPGSYVER